MERRMFLRYSNRFRSSFFFSSRPKVRSFTVIFCTSEFSCYILEYIIVVMGCHTRKISF